MNFMNKKMQYLIENSLKKKFKSKSFIISNIVIVVCLLLLVNIDTIINFFGGDFGKDINIYVVDDTDYVYEGYETILNTAYLGILDSNNYALTESDKTVEELSKEIKEEEKEDIIVHIKESDNIFEANIISYEYVDSTLYQSLVSALNTTKYNIALMNSSLSEEELALISKEVAVERTILDETLNEEEEIIKTIASVLIPIIILPFFMLILLIVSMIGAEINEEKTSKSMEIIISSVSPKIHFAAKVISVNIFVIAQSLLLVLYGLLAVGFRLLTSGMPEIGEVITTGETVNYIDLFLNSEIFKGILSSLPFVLVMFVLSFIAFSLFAGILASMTTNMEDYQQLQTPLSIIMLVGYYLAMFASMYESSLFIKLVSYVPLMSAIVAPALLLLGQYTIIDMVISIALLVVTIFLLIKYGSRIYKVGILNYSSSNLWKKMLGALKQK